jgi:hypothetical protein
MRPPLGFSGAAWPRRRRVSRAAIAGSCADAYWKEVIRSPHLPPFVIRTELFIRPFRIGTWSQDFLDSVSHFHYHSIRGLL